MTRARTTTENAALAVLVAVGHLATTPAAGQAPGGGSLRVCADPANLPLSNRRGEGYENKIAEALADSLNLTLAYTYFPQRMGFVRNTLRARDAATGQWKCDVIIGVPAGYGLAATTQPYLHSTYAMVFARRPALDSVKHPEDVLKLPAGTLRRLRFGVFAPSPGVDWLLRSQLMEQAVSYPPQSGDPEESPGATVERDLNAGNIDIAIVWGPIAGALVARHPQDWAIAPFPHDAQLKLDYEIAMGVRFGEAQWQETLNRWIAGNRPRISAIMASYGIPTLDESADERQAAEPPSAGTK